MHNQVGSVSTSNAFLRKIPINDNLLFRRFPKEAEGYHATYLNSIQVSSVVHLRWSLRCLHQRCTVCIEDAQIAWGPFEDPKNKVVSKKKKVYTIVSSLKTWACSSVDRARGYEPRSRGFESLLAHCH